MEACSVRAPYTLLGFLLDGGRRSSSSAAASFSGGGVCFSLRDYFARGTNFMLWISLVWVTLFLLTKLARLVRIWARGSRIRARIVAGCGSSCDLTAVPAKLGISEPNRNTDSLSFGSGSQTCIARKCAALGISTLFASLSPSYELVPGSKNEANSTVNDQAQPVPSPKSVFVRRNK